MAEFVHLHVHSDYSCLSSLASVSKLVSKCKNMRMPGMALTDIGNMYGAMEFVSLAKKENINPIIGSEFYIRKIGGKASQSKKNSFEPSNRNLFNNYLHMPENVYRLVLLAETQEGYKNLKNLSTLSFQKMSNSLPMLEFDDLQSHKEGLIVLSGGFESELFQSLALGQEQEATALAEKYRGVFGKEQVFLELQDHQSPLYNDVNNKTMQLAKKLDMALVATNQVYYLEHDDGFSHEVMLCIRDGFTIDQEAGFAKGQRRQLEGMEYHFKSIEEISASFMHVPEALKNTLRINERCNTTIIDKNFHMPSFPVADGVDVNELLHEKASLGLKKKLGAKESPLHEDRLEHELKIITSMGFASYFLIVADIIGHAKSKHIFVGPGRGSVVGSLTAYVLGITGVDPIDYDLIFERFLNPGRVSMPDIDIDFQDNRRDEVFQYVKERYGAENSCQIITYAKLKAKAVFKDVARVFSMDFQSANKLSLLIPSLEAQGPSKTRADGSKRSLLQAVYEENVDFRNQINASNTMLEIYKHALKLENLIRQTGIHAAGIIMSDKPVQQYIPLSKNDDGAVISQFDGHVLESHCGLLKMDFLGLRMLNLLQQVIERIRRSKGDEINLESLALDDENTFKLFKKEMTLGIFQFESDGMTRYLRDLQPSCLEDLIAMNALYRPGPLSWIPVFIAKKNKRTPIFKVHEDQKKFEKLEKICRKFSFMKDILKASQYIPIYQEQIMEICRVFAGFTLSEADEVRQAMGKKNKNQIVQLRVKFLEGAKKLEYDESDAVFVYDEVVQAFGGYGFNKSHSAGYALVAYWGSYLKANYLSSFITEYLNSEIRNLNQRKISRVIQELAETKIRLLAANINRSDAFFNEHENVIQFGLLAIRGLGEETAISIVKERKRNGAFRSLSDFLFRCKEEGRFNKQVIEALLKAGCFDELYEKVSKLGVAIKTDQLFSLYPNLAEVLEEEQRLHRGGQISFFQINKKTTDGASERISVERKIFEQIKPVHGGNEELKKMESAALGYLFRHDLAAPYREYFFQIGSLDVQKSDSWREHMKARLAGILEDLQVRKTKRGDEIAILKLHNGIKSLEVVCYTKLWNSLKQSMEAAKHAKAGLARTLEHGSLVFAEIVLKKNRREIDGEYSLLANTIKILNKKELMAMAKLGKSSKASKLLIQFKHKSQLHPDTLQEIKTLLEKAEKGVVKVHLRFKDDLQDRVHILDEKYAVAMSMNLKKTLSEKSFIDRVQFLE